MGHNIIFVKNRFLLISVVHKDEHEHKGKSDELYLSNEEYTEILNFVEHTNMAML